MSNTTTKSVILRIACLLCLVLVVIALAVTRFSFDGPLEGIYLLTGGSGALFELKNDLILGEYERLIGKLEFGSLRGHLLAVNNHPRSPYLTYDWHPASGHGYFVNFFPDGTKLLACFGRFLTEQGKTMHGLFVGGGLPPHYHEDDEVKMNATGMAYYTGREWHHVWCNANETLLVSVAGKLREIPTSDWTYVDSSVIMGTEQRLVVRSRHRAEAEGVSLHVHRYLLYEAGNSYITLAIRFTNPGRAPVRYAYVYGDEPWLGEYGTSAGNIGWTRDRLYPYETSFDPALLDYAGMFDHGNEAAGETPGTFTELGNFIEWSAGSRPTVGYFSNKIGDYASEKERVPLAHPKNRVLMLQWNERTLSPDQSETIVLNIGMAPTPARGTVPKLPPITLDLQFLARVLLRR